MTMDSWFDQEDTAMKALNEFRSQFGSDDGVYLVFEAKDGDVFSATSLELIQEMTHRMKNWQELERPEQITEEEWQSLNRIQRVQSATNAKVQVNLGETLRSDTLVPDPIPNSEESLQQIIAIADNQAAFPLFMYSIDKKYGGINIKTDFGAVPVDAETYDEGEVDFSSDDLDLAFDDFEIVVDESLDSEEIKYQETEFNDYISFQRALQSIYTHPDFSEHFNFYPIGNAPTMEIVLETNAQAFTLVLLMMLVMVFLLWILLHSFSAVIWPMLAIALSALWVVGITAWLDVAMSTLVSLTVMLILAVGVADCIHVMSTYLLYRRQGLNHENALTETYSKTGLPILLTTITTMAGMLAITVNGMQQFVVFGVTSAAGVFMALIFTIYLLPILLDIWHPLQVRKPPTNLIGKLFSGIGYVFSLLPMVFSKLFEITRLNKLNPSVWIQSVLNHVPGFVQRAPYTIASAFILIFVFCVYGTFQVRIDTNFIELYKEGTKLRTTYEVVDKHMMGTANMEVMLNMNASDAFMDPMVLKSLEKLQRTIEEKYASHVVRTHSLADLVKDTNKVMNDGTVNFEFIPEEELAVSQLLFLFNSANPEDRRALVSDDYSRSHIAISLRNAGSQEYSEFFDLMKLDINQAFEPVKDKYPEMEITVTGTLALMMQLMDEISTSQFKSLSLALIVISSILILTLGSFQAGILGIIPNMIPAVLSFGLMGWLGIPLDTDTLMVAPLIIGIAVDDTIHFITHYRMALARHNDIQKALISAIKEVGQAVTFTTLVLACGFYLLTFSDYLGLAKMGGFGSIAILMALLCDILFLPALIMIFKPTFGQKGVNRHINFSGKPTKGETA